MKDVNICVIGGGSRLWAVTLMKDLAIAPDLGGSLRLYDINYEAALSNEDLGKRIFAKNAELSEGAIPEGGNFTVRAEEKVSDALDGANIVILSIEPGLTTDRYVDLEIPAKYGIFQTVGDTIGPGGIFRATRAIPMFRHYARLIKQHCADAWVVNYTNPMTWCTTALVMEEPELKVLGCCHEVFGTQKFLAEKTAQWFDVAVPHHKEIKLDVCGVNHFTHALSASWNGKDLYPLLEQVANDVKTFADRSDAAQERRKNEEWFDSDHLVALDLLRNFGSLGAAGDRHLVEFVPWYLRDEKELNALGVIRTPYAWRLSEAERKLNKVYEEDELISEASEEEGVDIIRALMGLESLYTNVNVPNQGQIPWLPKGHVVETNAFIQENEIVPSVVGKTGEALQSMVGSVVKEQQLVLRAVFEDDEELLFQAFLLDPLVNLPVEQARKLFNEMKAALQGKES